MVLRRSYIWKLQILWASGLLTERTPAVFSYLVQPGPRSPDAEFSSAGWAICADQKAHRSLLPGGGGPLGTVGESRASDGIWSLGILGSLAIFSFRGRQYVSGGLVFGGCIRRMGAWIQYFQTLGHSNFIGFQNNVGHTHNWYVLPCSRTTMVNWASSFPRNGLLVSRPTLILRPVWVGVHCKFGRPKTFRENHLTTSELHWKFLIWSICKNGVHGITWAGFLRVFPAMRASFRNGLPTLGPTCFSTSYYQLLNHLRPNASFPKPHITNKDIGFLP